MRVVVLHAGGLGDLVLVEALLSGLRERYPHAHIELVCRAAVASVVELYERPPDVVHPLHFNPYLWELPSAAADQCAPFLATFSGDPVDLFVSAEISSTWLSEILAAALEPKETIFGDASTASRGVARIVVRLLGLRLQPGIVRIADAHEHELDRYARMSECLRRSPRLRPLRREMPDARRSIVLFPMGVPALKRWPFERFADACRAIAEKYEPERDLVLVGSPAERPALDILAAESGDVFTVAETHRDDLGEVAELIANAHSYLGIDTGLAHLAGAYGVPGVTVYGGGSSWPEYAPWGDRSAGVVAPIPCFGCRWDCAFDHAYCVEAVPVEDVVRAYTAICGADARHALTIEREAYTSQERTLFAEASRRYREAQDDRAARYYGILRLRDILERYAQRSRTRQSRSAGSPGLSYRLSAIVQRLSERDIS